MFISTTSMGGLLAFPLHSIYHAAKFGVQGWSEGMSYELGLHNIRIKTVALGAVATDFLGRSLEKALHPAYKELEEKLFATTESMMSQGVPAERIAEVVYEAATDDHFQIFVFRYKQNGHITSPHISTFILFSMSDLLLMIWYALSDRPFFFVEPVV